jgi:hypothetical protein
MDFLFSDGKLISVWLIKKVEMSASGFVFQEKFCIFLFSLAVWHFAGFPSLSRYTILWIYEYVQISGSFIFEYAKK